jgi:hypothetical protein
MYRCPTCKSAKHLDVTIETWARLIQPDDDPEAFQTDLDEADQHDHEWSDNSVMMCVNPECANSFDTHIAEHFEVDDEGEDESS